jgi:hypothetical protein
MGISIPFAVSILALITEIIEEKSHRINFQLIKTFQNKGRANADTA